LLLQRYTNNAEDGLSSMTGIVPVKIVVVAHSFRHMMALCDSTV
jgi:hypothetical protein